MLMFLHTLAHTGIPSTNDPYIGVKKVQCIVDVIIANAWYIFKVVVLASICLTLLVIANVDHFVSNMHQIQFETDDIAFSMYLLFMQIVHGSTCLLLPSLAAIYILVFRLRDIAIICHEDYVGRCLDMDHSIANVSKFASTPYGKYTAHYNASRFVQHECPISMQTFEYSDMDHPDSARILYCGHMFSKSCIEEYEADREPRIWRAPDGSASTPNAWRPCPICKDWYDSHTMRYQFERELNKGYFSLWVDYAEYGIKGI